MRARAGTAWKERSAAVEMGGRSGGRRRVGSICYYITCQLVFCGPCFAACSRLASSAQPSVLIPYHLNPSLVFLDLPRATPNTTN